MRKAFILPEVKLESQYNQLMRLITTSVHTSGDK